MVHSVKIGLVGPESTGKSTLSRELAAHFGGTCLPEYARQYVGTLQRSYRYEDVCLIAGQNRMEAQTAQGLTFFDTELIITKVWLDEVYGKRPLWITEPVPADCRMDYYLLTAPDLPGEPDPLRENLSQPARERLYERYLSEIIATGVPYCIIKGAGRERFACAERAVSTWLNGLR